MAGGVGDVVRARVRGMRGSSPSSYASGAPGEPARARALVREVTAIAAPRALNALIDNAATAVVPPRDDERIRACACACGGVKRGEAMHASVPPPGAVDRAPPTLRH